MNTAADAPGNRRADRGIAEVNLGGLELGLGCGNARVSLETIRFKLVHFRLGDIAVRGQFLAALEIPDPDIGYLERLAVLPGNRRKGFGCKLVDHVFHQAKDSGINKISIGIIAPQTDLKRWYQKIGFIEGGTKEFKHLPFPVTFMIYDLPSKGGINES